MAGVELLAQAIDSVIMRVQVRTLHFVNRIFHPGAKILKIAGQNIKGCLIVGSQVKLSNSTVRLEHMPGLEQRGIALELQARRCYLIIASNKMNMKFGQDPLGK